MQTIYFLIAHRLPCSDPVALSTNQYRPLLTQYSMIWWFRPCKPNIFWKNITLATSTALFWSSITKYQTVPPSTDPVPPSNNQCRPLPTNQYRLILTQFLQVPTRSALYWLSVTKYKAVFERISTCTSFLNFTTYWFTSGVEFDQGYLSFLYKQNKTYEIYQHQNCNHCMF